MNRLIFSVPVGTLALLDDKQRLQYSNVLVKIPRSLAHILFDFRTGAFLRGIAKNKDLTGKQLYMLSFITLQVGIGHVTLSALANALSARLKIEKDVARAIAQELERDLFSNVMLDLSKVIDENGASRIQKKEHWPLPTPTLSTKPRNVLDLNTQNQEDE